MCDDQDESLKEEPDGQRPLKKARYVWQVKGKYHLKETTESHKGTSKSSAAALEEEDEESSKLMDTTEIDTEIVNNNSIPSKNSYQCASKACIEALIEHSDNIMNTIQIPDSVVNIDRSISDDIPITLVKPNPKTDDFYLRKWQARQVAKGFVDNTINKVLENWMTPPFDAADFVENCDNDGHVEDEGILMAIQSHGLQSGNLPLDAAGKEQPRPGGNSSCTCSHNLAEKPLLEIHQVPFHRRNGFETDESDMYNFENVHNQLLHRAEAPQVAPARPPVDDCMAMDEHSDFLDAAVAVAIQKKGLSSYSYG